MSKDIVRIVSDKQQLDHDYEMLLVQFDNRDAENIESLGLRFVPTSRGYTRKNKAVIEVWKYNDFGCRNKTGALPQFHIRLFIDRELPRGLPRRLMMLRGRCPITKSERAAWFVSKGKRRTAWKRFKDCLPP